VSKFVMGRAAHRCKALVREGWRAPDRLIRRATCIRSIARGIPWIVILTS